MNSNILALLVQLQNMLPKINADNEQEAGMYLDAEQLERALEHIGQRYQQLNPMPLLQPIGFVNRNLQQMVQIGQPQELPRVNMVGYLNRMRQQQQLNQEVNVLEGHEADNHAYNEPVPLNDRRGFYLGDVYFFR